MDFILDEKVMDWNYKDIYHKFYINIQKQYYKRLKKSQQYDNLLFQF